MRILLLRNLLLYAFNGIKFLHDFHENIRKRNRIPNPNCVLVVIWRYTYRKIILPNLLLR